MVFRDLRADGQDEKTCNGSYDDNKAYDGSHTSHYKYEDHLRYNSLSYKLDKSYDMNTHKDCENSYFLSYDTSYSS